MPTTELPQPPGHPFYERVNQVPNVAGFDRFMEDLCLPHYAAVQGRPSIPAGTYFRMLMVDYFEGAPHPSPDHAEQIRPSSKGC